MTLPPQRWVASRRTCPLYDVSTTGHAQTGQNHRAGRIVALSGDQMNPRASDRRLHVQKGTWISSRLGVEEVSASVTDLPSVGPPDDVDPPAPDQTVGSAAEFQPEAPLPEPDETAEWLNATAEADQKLATLRQLVADDDKSQP